MRKYFLQDKNYILYGAQLDLQEELLTSFLSNAKEYYLSVHNPLGLMDSTATSISEHTGGSIEEYMSFYEDLCAIYRYKYGSNQLEFLFDGMDHFTKYSNEWKECFTRWCYMLFSNEYFLKTVLSITVFGLQDHSKALAICRLRQYVENTFNIRFYKHKGIIEKLAA